jgi:hypothetical protein
MYLASRQDSSDNAVSILSAGVELLVLKATDLPWDEYVKEANALSGVIREQLRVENCHRNTQSSSMPVVALVYPVAK